MSPVSVDKKTEILALLREGMDSAAIAVKSGVPLGTVRALRAHLTMGTYPGQSSQDAPNEEASEEAIDGMEATFGLERDLQSALRANIKQLAQGLRIVDDGKERVVSTGRIDILASDAAGDLIVIELKPGTADRDAIGQILSYMGALRAEGAKQTIKGILVAGDFTSRAVAAAGAVPNVQLQKYGFSFSFQEVR
jgi:hypothetical protein